MHSNYYILVASSIDLSPGNIEAITVYNHRIANCFWPFNERTKNRKKIGPGDFVTFYLAGHGKNAKHFISWAKVKTGIIKFDYSEPKEWYTIPGHSGICVDLVTTFDNPVSIHSIKNDLDFISNKKTIKWGSYMQGGCINISEKDFNTIRSF